MNKNWTLFMSLSVVIFMLLHILERWIPSEILLNALSLFGLFSIVSGFIFLSRKELLFPLFLVILATGIMFWETGQFAETLWKGFREMRALIPFVFVIPLLGWIIKHEEYIPALITVSQKLMKTPIKVYLFLIVIMIVSTFFFSLGAVFIIFSLSSLLLAKQHSFWKREKDIIILQGYSLCTLWALTEPSLVYALEATGAPIISTVLYGFGLSMIGLLLSTFLFKLRYTRATSTLNYELLSSTFKGSMKKAGNLTIEFFAVLIFFYITILFFLLQLKMSIIDIVSICACILVVLYFVYKRNLTMLLKNIKVYLLEEVPQKSREVAFIMSAGLMIVALTSTGLGERIFQAIIQGTEQIPFMNLIMIMPVIMVIIGFLGLPPVPTMVLLSAVMSNIELGYSPTVIVLTLLFGSVVQYLISPVTMPTLILSSLNQKSPFQNAGQFNWLFAVTFLLVSLLYVHLIHWFLT